MAGFQEHPVKDKIRERLRSAAEKLRRGPLTYLGMPGELAADVRLLGSLLEAAICVERVPAARAEMRRRLGLVPLKHVRYPRMGMWQYLRDEYPREPLVADVTFLDFYGGGLRER